MAVSYKTDSIGYLRRARARLDESTREGLFYAAFELRCGTEARLNDYLEAREDIAKHKKQGWKIMGSAKELDKLLRLGDTIFEACLLDKQGQRVVALYYTPIKARLRDAAGGRLHDLLHAMKHFVVDDDRWWSDTRSFLEQIYADLAFANRGTLMAPMMRSPDGLSTHMKLGYIEGSPIASKVHLFNKVGTTIHTQINYLDALPDYATEFLNPVG